MPNVLVKTKSGSLLEIPNDNSIWRVINDIQGNDLADVIQENLNELREILSDITPDREDGAFLFCAVPGCNNNKARNPEKSFFRFPEERVRCHQWVLYCQQFNDDPGKQRLILSDDLKICSDHFRQEQFVKNTNTLLKRTAVPCVPQYLWETRSADKRKTDVQELSPSNSMENQDSSKVLCRLCSNPSPNLTFIFDEIGLEKKLAHKINLCFPFEVNITDPLPKQICTPCLNELDELYAMADLCSSSQAKLLDMFGCDETISEIISLDLEKSFVACPLCDLGNMDLVQDVKTENELISSEICSENFPFNVDVKKISLDNNTPSSDLDEAQFLLWPPGLSSMSSVNSVDTNKCEDSKHAQSQVSLDEILVQNTDAHLTCDDKTYLDCCKILKNTNHFMDDQVNEIFLSCRVCGCEFKGESELLEHSFDHSCSAFYQCVACRACFTVKQELVEHILSHKRDRYVCNICKNEFNLTSSIESHLCHPQQCTVCSQIFQNDHVYNDHIKSHLISEFCNICYKVFPDKDKFEEHNFLIHDSKKNHCCEECGKIFKSEASMKYHQRIHNEQVNPKQHRCEYCSVYFSRHSLLLTHLTKFHINMPFNVKCYSCMLCYEAFPDNISALGHLKRIHAIGKIDKFTFCFEINNVNKIFTCEYCNRSYSDESLLHIHRETHPSENSYECKFCECQFKIKGIFDTHIQSHIGDIPEEYKVDFSIIKLFLCEFCERSFIEYMKYREHLSIHFGTNPYECKHCPLTFPTLTEAVQHRSNYPTSSVSERSDILRPYACHFCEKTFGIEDALTKHIRMHTGEKPFVCDMCGKGFSQSSGLYTHQKVHSSERPYNCSVCPRKFKIKGDRDVHVRKHSGERPYKCDYCGKAFMTQHVFSQHRKIHTNERPYRCDVCSLAFRRSHVLTVHKRIHTGEKPHACPVCTKRYRQKGDMLKHLRIQHYKSEVSDYPKG